MTSKPVTTQPAPAAETTDASGVIFDVKRFAIHDGPGIRTTVFFKGCPLTCPWCHNPEGIRPEPEPSLRVNRCTACGACVSACEHGAISLAGGHAVTDPDRCVLCGRCVDVCPNGAREIVGRRVTAGEVLAEIEKDVIFYDESGGGATFSGGEPLAQPEFLRALLAGCAARRIHTVLDTTCHAPWELIDSLRGGVGLFLCDVKHMDPAAHERLTGVGNERILANIRRLAERGQRLVIRVPVIPGANDAEDDLRAAGAFVASLNGVREVDLLPYNEGGEQKRLRLARASGGFEARAPSAERMAAVAAVLRDCGLTVRIGG